MPFPKIYQITVQREVVQTRVLYVRAYNEEDARRLAERRAPNLDFTGTEKEAQYAVAEAERLYGYDGSLDIDDCDPDA